MSRLHVILENNEFVSCEVFKLKGLEFDGGMVKCPLCKQGHKPTPKMDIIQHGFLEDDTITVMECQFCKQYFALKYTLIKEGE